MTKPPICRQDGICAPYTLTEREQVRLDLVGAVDLSLRVGQAGEGQVAGGREGARLLERAGCEREHLDPAAPDLLVPRNCARCRRQNGQP